MGGAAKPISEQQLYSPLRIWCIGLAITAIGVIASDLWLDQPIALFVHRTVADKTIFRLAAAASCRFFLAIFAHLRVVRLMDVVGAPSVARAVYRIGVQYYFHCDQPHNQSAQVRVWTTWPESWIEENPSLIQNGVFGFTPFHGGLGFASFPSGHVAAVCAVMAVLWWSYARLRPIYVACVAAVAVGLIGANYHFLSDILGGIFVGLSAGYVTTKISFSKMHL